MVGFEQQLPHNFVVSVRYINRSLKRIIEDAAVVAPSGKFLWPDLLHRQYQFNSGCGCQSDRIQGSGNTPVNQLPSQCDPTFYNPAVTDNSAAMLGGICYATLGKNGQPRQLQAADGVPDGFPDRCISIIGRDRG